MTHIRVTFSTPEGESMTPAASAAEPLHLTKREAAARLRISQRTLDRLDIARVKIRGKVLYRRDTLDSWSKAHESLATSEV